jgi:hypothetical protein
VPIANSIGVSAGVSLLWLGAQPEGPAQDLAPLPPGTLAAPRRPGQRKELTCQVSVLGSRAHLTASVIGKLGSLIWMHAIHSFLPDGMALTAGPAGQGACPQRPSAGRRRKLLSADGYFPIFGSPRLMTPYDLRRMLIRQEGEGRHGSGRRYTGRRGLAGGARR